jgi:hypothetical protein
MPNVELDIHQEFFFIQLRMRAARHFIMKEVNKYRRLGETPQSLHTNTPIKTENKINTKKIADLTGSHSA